MKKDRAAMRSEYDFSRGTRGKHAGRLGEEGREELRRQSAALDARYWFGHALQRIQELEAIIVAYVSLALDRTPELAGKEVAALVEAQDPDLLSHLAVAVPSWNDRFKQILDERSWLIHKGGYAIESEWHETHVTAEIVARFEAIARAAGELGEDLRTHLETRLADSGLGSEEARRRTQQVIVRWLAA
jgi:hypothetical protein